jgi:hypothetical protein
MQATRFTSVLGQPLELNRTSHFVKSVDPMRDSSLSAACSLCHGVIGRYLLNMKVELRQCTGLDMFESPDFRIGSYQTTLHCKSRS